MKYKINLQFNLYFLNSALNNKALDKGSTRRRKRFLEQKQNDLSFYEVIRFYSFLYCK